MTDVFFGGSDVERVDLSYHESLQRIVKGDVDAVIWNVVAENELTMLGLERRRSQTIRDFYRPPKPWS